MFSAWKCPSPVFSCFMLTEVRNRGIRRRKEKGLRRGVQGERKERRNKVKGGTKWMRGGERRKRKGEWRDRSTKEEKEGGEEGWRCYYFIRLSSSLVIPGSNESYSNFIFNSIPKLSLC